MSLKFKCPNCGCTRLVEKFCDVTLYSEILGFDRCGAEYATFDKVSDLEGGEVNYYFCHECDFVLDPVQGFIKIGDSCNWVHDNETLKEWLKEHGMLEE